MHLFNTGKVRITMFRAAYTDPETDEVINPGTRIQIQPGVGTIIGDDEWEAELKKSKAVRSWVADRIILTGDDAIAAQPADVQFDDQSLEVPDEDEDIDPDLGNIATVSQAVALADAGYNTLEKVAEATVPDLVAIPGIGMATATKMIDAAKELVE